MIYPVMGIMFVRSSARRPKNGKLDFWIFAFLDFLDFFLFLFLDFLHFGFCILIIDF